MNELEKSLEDANFKVDTIVCSECNFIYNFKEKDAVPCDHLADLVKDWKNV